MTRLRLDLEWRITLLTLLLLPTLISLGFWQLERADEKAQISAQNEQRAGLAPQALAQLAELETAAAGFRQVALSGEFIPGATAFLDNQIRDGRYGHDVISIFKEQSTGMLALVNRGWVPGDASRRSLPSVDTPAGEQRLSARIYIPPGEPYLLEEDRFDSLRWPVLLQSANSPQFREALASEYARDIYPHMLRLQPGSPAGFRRDWPVVNVSPQKHRGYALQWFTMAAALLLLFIVRSSNVVAVLRGRPADRPREN